MPEKKVTEYFELLNYKAPSAFILIQTLQNLHNIKLRNLIIRQFLQI